MVMLWHNARSAAWMESVDKSSEGICRLDDKVRTSRKPRDNEIQISKSLGITQNQLS